MYNSVPVICSEQSFGGSQQVGVIELRRPETLNALNAECYQIIESKLLRWQKDSHVAAIIFHSENERSFCAGGDVKGLVLGMRDRGLAHAEEFFTLEYFVDYLIHEMGKPVIAICDGITMGGGLGLVHGATHRIATERTVIAMPELAIGLFPDVGATHFLSKLPQSFGLFMGITGARVSASDALNVGLIDYIASSKMKRKLFSDLIRLPWGMEPTANAKLVTQYLNEVLGQKSKPALKHFEPWVNIFQQNSYLNLRKSFLETNTDDPLYLDAKKRFEEGSPLSKQLFFKAYHEHKNITLRQAFEREWAMAIRACQDYEFKEGVRALLIDKDQRPKWTHTQEEVILNLDQYFETDRDNLLRHKFSKFFGNV